MTRLLRPLRLPARASAGLLVLRLVVGLAFLFHGYGKIQHPFSWMGPESHTPAVFQGLAAFSEFGGGLAWMLGLLTPVAALGLLCTMGVAIWTVATKFQGTFVSATGGVSYEVAAAYLGVAVLLLLAGPGRFSLDRLIFGERD